MNSETISMILSDSQTSDDKLIKRAENQINCACVGIITDVNFEEQTVEVQPVIKRTVLNKDLTYREENMPIIPDIPFCCYKGGGYSITVPVAIGDECLLVFADNDFSAWQQSGGIQNQQTKMGRHTLGNAIAIVGLSSNPNAIPNYNPNGIEIRNSDASEKILITSGNITLKSATITLDGNVTTTGTSNLQGTTTIQEKDFLSHVHSNGNQGANTGGVQ